MSEWFAQVNSLISQGQLGESLLIFRCDRMTGATEIMRATMEKVELSGSFQFHDETSPFVSTGIISDKYINELLQVLMDLAWKRGLKPTELNPSHAELTAVRAHLEDMRALAKARPDVA